MRFKMCGDNVIYTHTHTHDTKKKSLWQNRFGHELRFRRTANTQSNECNEYSVVFHSLKMICQPMLMLLLLPYLLRHSLLLLQHQFSFSFLFDSCVRTTIQMFIHAFVTAPHNRFLYFYLPNDFQWNVCTWQMCIVALTLCCPRLCRQWMSSFICKSTDLLFFPYIFFCYFSVDAQLISV